MSRPASARGLTPATPRRRWRTALLLLLAVAIACAAALEALVAAANAPPRELGPYLQWRASGHGAALERAGEWLAGLLEQIDRGELRAPGRITLHIGAQVRASESVRSSDAHAVIDVASVDAARDAFATAQPGDVIEFMPGTYRFGRALAATRPGTLQAPIVVRAARPGTVVLEILDQDGVVVSAPHWAFENLTLQGGCSEHSACEHGFHVVGAGSHFVARNNTLVDFNAHIKVNGEGRNYPDDGLVEGNTLTNRASRDTDKPVSAIDLVGASRWVVRGNLITDIVKAGGDRLSYGGFAKGGGVGNVFVGNVVWCEHQLRGIAGWRVGLSLGGGGTGPAYCRDRQCIVEQDNSRIESNLIGACSDEGIYVNRGASSRITHNTLVDTGGIAVRFPESSADVEGNLVDGAIRARDGALLREVDNLDTDLRWLYLGRHPQRALFRDAPALDFAWRSGPPRRTGATVTPPGLCSAARQAQAAYGAFDDFAPCLGRAAETINSP